MAEFLDFGARRYAVQFMYSVPDDAWCVELSEAVPAPAEWADLSGAVSHLPGSAMLLAVVPDKDPARKPTVHFNVKTEPDIPYEVMRWFMNKVDEEVTRARVTLAAANQLDDGTELPEQ